MGGMDSRLWRTDERERETGERQGKWGDIMRVEEIGESHGMIRFVY